LPAWDAVIEHVPVATNVAVVPFTVQTVVVVDAKLTASPEVAVAVSGSVVPIVCVPIVGKVIVCGWPATLKLCVTGVAAAYVVFPACVAVMEHDPEVKKVAVLPVTVQTDVVEEE
jgi:hypothetical protein